MSGSISRTVAAANDLSLRNAQGGRAYVAVIGIDRYRAWNQLYNAVSDASGALGVFSRLGFEPVGAPLFNEHATANALHRIVTDDLTKLGKNDSLVLFFAGHGHTVTRTFFGGTSVKDGYIIPVDGAPPGGSASTWMRLESWLKDVTRIPAQHILVILDACHSGLALGPVVQWRSRGMDMQIREPLDHLRARRSRRIITSALDDQRAMDGGPVPGHSLFTGCLIEALTSGLVATTGQSMVTGSQIGFYIQRRVIEYPNSTQTPDFGALELDDRGELVVRLAPDPAASGAITLPLLPAPGVLAPEPAALPPPTQPVMVRKAGSWRIAGALAVLAPGVIIVALAVTSTQNTAHSVVEPGHTAGSDGFVPDRAVTAEPREPTHPVQSSDQRWIPVQPTPVTSDAGSEHVRSKIEPNDGSIGGSNTPQPSEVIKVILLATNGVAFDVFENGTKLLEGPDVLQVRKGEQRTVVIKARGFIDKTVVVTGAKRRVIFSLERVPANSSSVSAHKPLPSPAPDCSDGIVDPGSQVCIGQYCARHHDDTGKCGHD